LDALIKVASGLFFVAVTFIVLWWEERKRRKAYVGSLETTRAAASAERVEHLRQMEACEAEIAALRSAKNLAESRLAKAERPGVVKATSWAQIRRMNEQENNRQQQKEIDQHENTSARTD
jgi:hypothetical protein